MGTASHNSDPDWYHGPKYVEIIALPPSSNDVYFDGRATVGPTWDFDNSEIYKWLKENYKDKFNYTWGIELEDDRMLVHISFAVEDHVKAFKEKFETLDWNMECDNSRMFLDANLLFYNLEDENEYYDLIDDAIQWCRENIRDLWKYTEENEGFTGVYFYFIQDADAVAFKLRFL